MEPANDLNDVVDVLASANKSMKSLRTDFQRESRTRKLQNGLLATALAVVVVLLIAMFNLYSRVRADFETNEQARCEQTNTARVELRDAFGILVIAIIGEDPTPEVQADAEEFIDSLNERFPERNCNEI